MSWPWCCPRDTWITTAVATSTPDPAAATGAAAAGAAATPAGPSLKLGGCAETQSKVAETMVRLRNLHRAEDVTLDDSARPVQSATATSASSSSTAGAPTDGCGDDYAFNVTIAFTADAPDATGKRDDATPVTLGGGS